jgi:hypothetical protein
MAKLFDKVSQSFLDAIRGVVSESKLDPVNPEELKGTHAQRKDKDINNDGKVDKTDEYLHNRRKAIKHAMKKKMKEEVEDLDELSSDKMTSYLRATSRTAKSPADSEKRKRGAAMAVRRLEKEEVQEAREPNKPYVKPHSGGAWKASNKWGKVKYFGKDFKKSAEKHAGISENLIDEISTKRALDYMDKASDARGHKNMSTAKQDKRYKSMALAHEKIRARRAKVPTTEEMDIETEGYVPTNDMPTDKDRNTAAKVAELLKRERDAKKMKKEEAEQIDELSKKTLGSYINKAASDVESIQRHITRGGTKSPDYKNLSTMRNNRKAGITRAVDKLTKEDVDLDEGLMHDRYMRSHGKKARGAGSWAFTTKQYGSPKEKEMHFTSGHKSLSDAHKEAAAKLGTKHLYVMEEVEQIDELSPERLAKYKKQAEKQSGGLMKTMRKHFNKADRVGIGGAANTEKSQKHTELGRAAYSKALKRTAGAAMASSKLTKEELAMIEAKMAGVADGALPGDEHMCATKVFHKEWAEGMPITTMHADPDENGLIEWYDVMFDHGIERVMTEDMEIISEMSHGHKKRGMKKEDVELDEARGRPKKAGAKDFTIHPKTKEKLMHNNPAHMKRIENLYRIGTLERPKKEAGQNVITQLRKASTSMRGGETINFTHGVAKHVSGTHAAKLLDKHASMKPAEKEAFQKEIGHSHEKLKKHL